MTEEELHAAQAAEEPEDTDADGGGDDDDLTSESDTSEAGGDQEGGAKKKKRKKKKKKKSTGGSGSEAGGDHAACQAEAASRKDGERRLREAVALLASNSEDSMWVRLGGAHLVDAKLSKLCEALPGARHVITLDLSANELTDGGVAALAGALRAEGAAPDLLDLDLRGNPGIGEAGLQVLAELVRGGRKQLRVVTGPLPSAAPAPAPTEEPAAPEGGGGGGGGGDASLSDSLRNNAMVRKYFQVGGGGEEGGGEEEDPAAAAAANGEGGAGDESPGIDPADLAAALWDAVLEALGEAEPHIPAISEPLRAIAEQVEGEMSSCSLPMLEDTTLEDLQPCSAIALAHLPALAAAWALEPPPLRTAYSPGEAVPAVGTHRAATAELMAQLLRAQCPAVAAAVAAAGLLPAAAALAAARPNCSALQCAVLRCVRAALSPQCGAVAALWAPLLRPAEGPAAAAAGAAEACSGAGGCLAEDVAAIGAAAIGVAIGSRAPSVGFAVAAADLLQVAASGVDPGPPTPSQAEPGAAAAEDSGAAEPQQQQQQRDGEQGGAAAAERAPWQDDLAAALAGGARWQGFASDGGPLASLQLAQQGDLGGPKPARRLACDEMDMDLGSLGGGGGQIISGQELLMMLRGLVIPLPMLPYLAD